MLSAKRENIRQLHNLKTTWSLTSHCTCTIEHRGKCRVCNTTLFWQWRYT